MDPAGTVPEIAAKVSDQDLVRQLHERLELAEQEWLSAVEQAKTKVAGGLPLKASAKHAENKQLKASLDVGAMERQPTVADALNAVAGDRDALPSLLEASWREKPTSRLS